MRILLSFTGALLVLGGLMGSGSHQAPSVAEAVAVVQQQQLPDVPGKTATMVVVSYQPGEASAAHVHPGSVFAYVLEGEVESQLEGGKVVKYKAGDSWYERPDQPHLVSRNASSTAPAKLLAVLLHDDGVPIKKPVK